MTPSSQETRLLYLGFACMAASLFAVPLLHLPSWTEMVFLSAGFICFIGVFVARRRRRRDSNAPATPRQAWPLALRIFLLFLIAATSLSSPWWLPYTGVTLDFRYRVISAVVCCVFLVAICLFSWRGTTKA